MNKRIRKKYKSNRENIILNHIKTNINIYIFVLILFIIGLSLGVIIVNKQSDIQKKNTTDYITSTINLLKTETRLNKAQILRNSLIRNFIIIFIIWTLGLTFFGKFFLYFIIFIFGITFGYTTSSIMLPFNIGQSLLLFISTIFFQSTIAIPTLIFLCVEGIKCHRSFLDGENIKYIAANYSLCMAMGMIILIVSSIIEVYISDNLIIHVTKYL